MKRTEKGITLIALIITIIVMLILVGVTVTSALNGGLFNIAKDAVDKTKAEQEEENKLDEGMIKINGDWITIEEYTGTVDFAAAMENTTEPHPDQENSNDIGIGTDGKLVNLDLWKYTYIDGKDIKTEFGTTENIEGYVLNNVTWDEPNDEYYCNESEYGYIGKIQNGRIMGKVPTYIKTDENDNFIAVVSMASTFYYPDAIAGMEELTIAPNIPNTITDMNFTFFYCRSLTTAPTIPSSVTNMSSTFSGCTSLTTAPTIPSSVTNMDHTFSSCTNLSTAPTIPNSVTNMENTFFGCTNLTTAPTIPSSVTNMLSTFDGCTNLSTAPTIPSSVTNMENTFLGCTSLTGDITINADPSSYSRCFNNASTADTANLKVKGISSLLSEIVSTKSENSNISLAP